MSRQFLIWLILTLLGTAAFAGFMILPLFGINFGMFGFMGFGVACLLVLGFRDVLEVSQRANTRSNEMRQAADRISLSFRKTSPCNVLGWSESFELTRDQFRKVDGLKTAESEGYVSKKLSSWVMPDSKNVMEGSVAGARLAIFDFQCDNPRGGEDAVWTQTVMALQSARLNFPHFALLPATFWSRLAAWFRTISVPDLQLPDGYRLITGDTSAPDRLIPGLKDWLDGKVSIEAGEEFLLVYRRDKLVDPFEVEQLLESGLHIYEALAAPKSM